MYLARLMSCLLLSCLLYSASSAAFFDTHLPLSSAETHKRVPMQHLATLDPSKLLPVLKLGSRTIQLTANADEDLVLSGQTKTQGSWTVRLNNIYAMFPSEVYQADLDANGQQDLILLKPTAGNGLAPTEHLLVLSFDQDGQVMPWQVEGYFVTDKQGIVDFLDLNGNGRAELVYMSYGEGYWQTVLYEVKDGKWQQIRGKFAGKNYPLFTRFTLKPNHKVVPASQLKPAPKPANLATNQAVLTGQLKSYQWANVDQSEDISLMLQTNKALLKCQPASWYSLFMLVTDQPKQREIISLAASPNALQAALNEAVSQHNPIELYGQRSAEGCTPEQMWIKSSP